VVYNHNLIAIAAGGKIKISTGVNKKAWQRNQALVVCEFRYMQEYFDPNLLIIHSCGQIHKTFG